MININQQFVESIWFFLVIYSPLGVVGIWRWGVWGIKKIYALQYRPRMGTFTAPVAVVTPVYNEDPALFQRALESWHSNGVAEIIAVIDHTDTRCITVFNTFSQKFPQSTLIVTTTPGKRPALAAGVRAASAPFVALVDSDTVWGAGVRTAALAPFADARVGAVGTYQSVLVPVTLAQRIFNIQLHMRYLEEVPFLAARHGTAIRCLSGRTAFYRRAALVPLLPQLLNETFWGQPVISGDDKRLTYLLQGAGWHATFQQQAHVYTPGVASLAMFFKQRLRWTRNSWRADLKVLGERWVWRHPRLVFHLLDNIVQPFAQLLSPTFFVISLYVQQWVPALVLLVWWHIGRVIRNWPHLRRRPQDLMIIPILITYNFWSALIKIYGLFTLYQQGWITRWDTSRLPQLRALAAIPGYVATVLVMGVFSGVVLWHEGRVVAAPPKVPAVLDRTGIDYDYPADSANVIERYVVQRGDTIRSISRQVGVSPDEIVAANGVFIPDINAIWTGMVLSIPRRYAVVPSHYETDQDNVNSLRITVDEDDNTIHVRGRGHVLTLGDIAFAVGPTYLNQTSPGEWYAQANIFIHEGVSLQVVAPQVTWLKLRSDQDHSVWLRTTNGQIIIDGVKVTSWNAAEGAVDHVIDDGRSFIAATHGARLDLKGAELAWLGDAQEAGVQWTVPRDETRPHLLTGQVIQNSFHNLHGGLLVRGATGMQWAENKYYANTPK